MNRYGIERELDGRLARRSDDRGFLLLRVPDAQHADLMVSRREPPQRESSLGVRRSAGRRADELYLRGRNGLTVDRIRDSHNHDSGVLRARGRREQGERQEPA